MPKLPVVTGARAVKALGRAGFVVTRRSGSHTIMRHPETMRRVSVPVHSGQDLPPGTLRRIIADAGLTVEQFRLLLK